MMLDNCEKLLKLINSVSYINSFKPNKKCKICACEALEEDYSNIKIKYDNLNKEYLYNKTSFDQKIEQPFAIILEENGISKEIIFTKDELLVLKLAVNHNNGIVNLCNKTDTIRSLMMKGLVKLNDDGLLAVDNTIATLLKTKNANGCLAFNKNLNASSNENIASISWGNFN